MKFYFNLILSAFSMYTIAQTGNINLDNVTIKITGKGGYVCSAQAMNFDRPVLARGESLPEAKALAMQQCQKQGHAFHCDIEECEQDSVNKNLTDIIFDISKDSLNVDIKFRGKVKYICTIEVWRKTYFAKAATKVEAKVLTSNECASANNGNAFHCDVEDSDCTQISGTSVKIGVGDILDKILGQ